MKKRIVAIICAAAMMVAALAGCGGSGDSGTQGDSSGGEAVASGDYGTAQGTDTVVVAIAEEPANISAYNHSTLVGGYFNRLTFNGLMKFDHDLNPVCDLAESYEVKEDENGVLCEWYFYLKQGVLFHDGTEMHAEDVVASLETALATPECAMFTASYNAVEEVDEYTVKITTNGESAAFLSDLCIHSNYICPKALLDEGWDFNSKPIGTGPYKFEDWTISESLSFVANEDYFDTENAPKIDNVVFKIIPENSSRTIALEAGEIDYVVDFDTNEMASIEDGNYPEVTLLTAEGTGHNYLVFNTEESPYDDENLRKAINCAINKEDVITVAMNGAASVALSCAPNNMLGSTDENTLTYSVEEAEKYLEAWGGDVSTLNFEIICKNETHKHAAEVVQECLRQIGIECTVSTYDNASYSSMIASGEYTAAMASWTTETVMGYLNGNFNSASINSTNRARWNESYTDEMLAKVCGTVDETQRAEYASELIAYLNEHQVTIPLYQNNIVSASNVHLQGTSPLQAAGNLYIEDWYWE